jgi:hypothetical protein
MVLYIAINLHANDNHLDIMNEHKEGDLGKENVHHAQIILRTFFLCLENLTAGYIYPLTG